MSGVVSTPAVGPRRTSGGGARWETMIGIAALFVGVGIGWLCYSIGVYILTRTGREGMRIQRMEDERRQRPSAEQ